MSRKQKKMLIRILAAAVLLIALHVIPAAGAARFVLYLIPYLVIGYDILIKAAKGIKNRQVFDECFLMAVATVGAFALALYDRSGDYTEAVAVMLFYQIGELFQSYAVGKSRRNISDLMDIRPDYANVERDGKLEQVDPDEVEIGSVILVQPGEKVPIDGVVLEGSSSLNTSALTGESLPRDVGEGDEIISGCINLSGRAEDSDHERVWGIDGVQNPGSGGERQLPEIPVGELYLQIRPDLYACGLLCGSGPGRAAAPGAAPCFWHVSGLGNLDLPGPDLPGYQLPLRSGHQHSLKLLRGNRRRQQRGRAGEGLQLSGDPLPGEDRGI